MNRIGVTPLVFGLLCVSIPIATALAEPTAEQMAGWSAEQWADLAIAESEKIQSHLNTEIHTVASQVLAGVPARQQQILALLEQAKTAWREMTPEDLRFAQATRVS